ncbi:hypothetical protein GLOIN_2v1685305 [Rhizophagus clarus]|uniref:Uncharacterized protein n=1 Tax=Rhizophagus clarus TaxID=94130 RepID=A0A8H3LQZ5_9GLOM|nr:hypothetical protein GLOIN_2v1685305 [Rhizophagus clarus]
MKELKKAEEEWKKTKSEAIKIRDFHIENLYELLLKSFYERNYCRASKILEILLKCSECDMTRIWQPAIGVLTTLDPTSIAFIDFFNIMLLKTYTKKRDVEDVDKQKVIMELVFYQVKYGQTIDALATIETYLPQEPYCNNPLLYGYAGLISYSLWEQLNVKFKKSEPEVVGYKPQKRKNASKMILPPRERSKRKRKRNADEKDDDFIEVDDQIMDQHQRYYENSLRNFRMSLDMDMSNDIFLVHYVKLLLYKEEIGEAINAIQNFCNENPSILTGHRLLFEVLYTYERLKYEWVDIGKTYHRIDPVSPPDEVFNPLMEHYTQVIEQTNGKDRDILADAYFNICELLFQRIECGDDSSNYLYQAIEYFVWLEHSDVDKVKVNELLKNRVKKVKEHILSGKNFHTVLYNFEKKKYYGNIDGNIDWNVDWNTSKSSDDDSDDYDNDDDDDDNSNDNGDDDKSDVDDDDDSDDDDGSDDDDDDDDDNVNCDNDIISDN